MAFTYPTWGNSWLASWGGSWGAGTPPPPPVTDARGGYGEKRKRKQRDFDEERHERERLREAIVAAVSPIKATKAEVVSTAADGEEGVAILTRKSKIAIPVPASFDAAEVARMVNSSPLSIFSRSLRDIVSIVLTVSST